MSFQRTFPGLIQKRLQYIEEVTYGVTRNYHLPLSVLSKVKRFRFNIDAQITVIGQQA